MQIIQKHLKQSSRAWNEKFNNLLSCCGFKRTNNEPCLYVTDDCKYYLLIYIDDILIAAESLSIINNFVDKLKSRLKLKISQPHIFQGLMIGMSNDNLTICQTHYIDKLVDRLKFYRPSKCLDKGKHRSYAVNIASRASKSTIAHIKSQIRILRFIKGT